MLENDSYSGYQLKSVLDEAVKQFPKNSTLWIKSLRCHLEPKEDEPLFQIDTGAPDEMSSAAPTAAVELPAMFWESIKALGSTSDSIPVWETAIEHFETVSKENRKALETLEELYKKALAAEPPVGNYFKPRYLSWIAAHKGSTKILPPVSRDTSQTLFVCFSGRDEAYKLYKAQAALPPLVLDFHYKMLELELGESRPNVDVMRQIYDKAAMQFGQLDKGRK